MHQIVKAIEYLETQVREHSFLGQNGQFVTNRNYPKFAIQEMVVNSVCHRDYSIKGTEIQIKMFDNRLVFESPGRLPGLVRAENIRHTHFSRNPKIAQFLKAYSFVKEFGEGIDRICNELESRGSTIPSFHTDAFILKATLMAEFVDESVDVVQTVGGTVGGTVGELKVAVNGEIQLTERQIDILHLIDNDVADISQNVAVNVAVNTKFLADSLGLNRRTIQRELAWLQKNNLVRWVGADKNGHWETIKKK